jgi:MerR family transcriptional regulator, heat shock protein HspR
MDEREPLYAIAVAARLTRMHPQTLRKYERAGLLRPARQSGNQRLYSNADLRRLRRIRYLVERRGLNVAGLEITLAMVDRLERLEEDSTRDEMRRAIDDAIAIGGSRPG